MIINIKNYYSHFAQNVELVTNILNQLPVEVAVFVLQFQDPVVSTIFYRFLLKFHISAAGAEICHHVA